MNSQRDKFLAEQMGWCWHDTPDADEVGWLAWKCSKCGKHGSVTIDSNGDHLYSFSTSNGFFILWNWCKRQDELWFTFKWNTSVAEVCNLVDPDAFADFIYKMLKEKK